MSTFLNPWTAPGDDRVTLFAPFIREGDAICLAGEKGSGKSTAACEFIWKVFSPPCHATEDGQLDIENEIPYRDLLFGGLLKVQSQFLAGRKAVVLDAENDHVEWRSLLNQTMAAYGVEPDSTTAQKYFVPNVLWGDGSAVNWNNYEAAKIYMDQTLFPELDRVGCGMLVLDSTHKFWTVGLNEPQWVSEGLGHMRKRCRERGITLICLTHTSRDHKDKSWRAKFLPRGTSQQENEFDCVLGLERNLKDQSLRLCLVKRRSGKWCEEYTVGHCFLSDTYGGYGRAIKNPWPKGDPRNPDLAHLSSGERDFLNKLTQEWLLFSEIKGNRKHNKARIETLFDHGFLEEKKEGRGHFYRLSSKAADALKKEEPLRFSDDVLD